MKLPYLVTAILLAAVHTSDVYAGASINFNTAGMYGRIELGGLPQPQFVYPTPVIIQPPRVGVAPPPVYLHVPPGHAKDWKKHCAKYHACNQPVYFVHEDWYNTVYIPHHHSYRDDDEWHDKKSHHHKGHGKKHDD